ncbi:MAG: OmpA family protein [Sterolibacterium sp.]|jgi:hypothetical protein
MRSSSRQCAIAALFLMLVTGSVFADRPMPDAVITFASGTDTIPASDDHTLERLSAKAKADPGNWINLEAYANDLGSRELNLALAQRRIEDVSRRLALLGIPTHRIRGISHREERSTEDDLPMHRIEIRIEKLGL